MKILLAGILGAIAMFIWTAIAHMALPLGEAGVTEIPNESAVLSTDAKQHRRPDRSLHFSWNGRRQERKPTGKE